MLQLVRVDDRSDRTNQAVGDVEFKDSDQMILRIQQHYAGLKKQASPTSASSR
jgi:hypothetical protein